jgi:hypothetical protein
VVGGGHAPHGDKCPRQPSASDEGGQWCLLHNSNHHSVEVFWEIKKFVEQFCEQQKLQPCHDGTPFRQLEGKQKVAREDDKDEEMAFQYVERALKAVYDHSDFNSSTDEFFKMLHVMYGGSWEITSKHIIKTLHQALAAAAPATRATPHHKWMETLIGFDASGFPNNMVGAMQLPLVVSPTITNVRMYHVLIDGGTTLNFISVAAFQKLQKLSRSYRFLCPSSVLRGHFWEWVRAPSSHGVPSRSQ